MLLYLILAAFMQFSFGDEIYGNQFAWKNETIRNYLAFLFNIAGCSV